MTGSLPLIAHIIIISVIVSMTIFLIYTAAKTGSMSRTLDALRGRISYNPNGSITILDGIKKLPPNYTVLPPPPQIIIPLRPPQTLPQPTSNEIICGTQKCDKSKACGYKVSAIGFANPNALDLTCCPTDTIVSYDNINFCANLPKNSICKSNDMCASKKCFKLFPTMKVGNCT